MKPQYGATNVTPEKVTIEFNELVNVRDAFTKVTVSPPGTSTPRVAASGKKVTVNFFDTLRPNTTYTIDFGNSIEDNNEGNKLNDFSYTFSTGPTIDTLRIAGMVLGASDLEPQQGILVGVHSAMEDSVFISRPFERMTRTDDRGRFVIRGLAPGSYRVFALADVNNDYRWDNPEEVMAFYPSIVSPRAERVEITDTIYNLISGLPDTTRVRTGTRFLPDDILLSSFKPDFKPQFISSYSRPDSAHIQIFFNARNFRSPEIKLLDKYAPAVNQEWYIPETSHTNDSISLWISDPILSRRDSINLSLTYIFEQAPNQFTTRTDTLLFAMRRMPVPKKKKDQPQEMRFLDVKVAGGGSNFDVNSPLRVEFPEPPAKLDPAAFRLEQRTDTVWSPVPDTSPIHNDSVNPRKYLIEYPWKYDTSYRLQVDSLAVTGISGLHNKPLTSTFTTRKESDYGLLDFRILGLPDSIPAFVELLNSSDNPVRKELVKNGGAIFRYLVPGEYYARLIEDTDADGEYDTGNFITGQQPEAVSYFPKEIKIRANWDREYQWDLNALSVDRQKPDRIKKNKPALPKNQRNRNQQNAEKEEEDYFDPTANPFDPNSKKRRHSTTGSYY